MTSVLSRSSRRPPADPSLRARDEKLESLKAVAGKLAHDFNNFLVPQFGYVTLLKEELPADSPGARYVATLEANGRMVEGHIESILLGMRPQRQCAPAEFSFSELLNAVLDDWQQEASPAGIELHRQIESCTVFGDKKHWGNAIGHLLSNARFALPAGGMLEVSLERRVLDGSEIERLGLDREEVYQLTVRDHGFGMEPAVAERAFDPFFTTRGRVKGAGLGLTIVHSVTQFHGGQVELRSVEGQGTGVTLWIPGDWAPL